MNCVVFLAMYKLLLYKAVKILLDLSSLILFFVKPHLFWYGVNTYLVFTLEPAFYFPEIALCNLSWMPEVLSSESSLAGSELLHWVASACVWWTQSLGQKSAANLLQTGYRLLISTIAQLLLQHFPTNYSFLYSLELQALPPKCTCITA